MQQLFVYIVKVMIISSILLLYYFFSLRNRRFHYYNRFYLLSTVIISTVLPVLHLHWFSFSSRAGSIIMYRVIYSGNVEDFTARSSISFNWQPFIIVTVIAISVCLLMHLVFSIIKIYRLKKVYPVHKLDNIDFIHTDLQSAPFSFFNNIFWRNDISTETLYGKQILQHEITHIRQKHSVDKIFMQLVLGIYWINPFFWWLKKELYLIHEFIADEKAVSNNNAAAFAQMLLASRYGKFEFLPAQSIFYSSIKRRLIMLTTSKKTQLSYLRRIMILPLMAVVVCLFAFTLKNKDADAAVQKIKAANPFVLVVDAGHGGKDFGAHANGVYEKNLSLEIARTIKKLSPGYGIDVVLTRDNDVYMSPQEKANFANTQNANAFISVHVNAADLNHINQSGMEVILSRKNAETLNNSQVLGSAILQNLQPHFTVVPALLQQQVGIWILDQSKIPSALIECGYITNLKDVKLLKEDAEIELMARNILQGVAMYSNNTIDKTNLYKIENRDTDTSTPNQSNSMLQPQQTPLYVLDDKIISKSIFDKVSLEPEKIMSVNVLKDQEAINKYGEKGKNGVVEIMSKANDNSSSSNSQTATDTSTKPIFTTAQKEPEFPGGLNGWRKYLEGNLNASVPSKKHAPKGIYTVTLSFLIDENGKVSDVKAIKDPGFGTAEEAVRVIAKGPNWIPAVQNGHHVNYLEKQNISFSVDN